MHSRHSGVGPARLCVTNAKGGTGKTTVAINLAGALHERGRDVLFVDLDPQGNATEGLGFGDSYDAAPPTLFDALTRDPDLISDLVVEHPEMDVVPSSVDMLQAEHELTIADLVAQAKAGAGALDPAALADFGINVTPETVGGPHALDSLDRALTRVESAYDYVIIDSPPFYGKLTDTGVFAARTILVPALAEATSERAIELLLDQMAALERQADITVAMLGIVANRIETTSEDEMMLEWFRAAFPDRPVWEVRKRVALQRAYTAGTSVFASDDTCDMTAVFDDMAAQCDQQFGLTEELPA